MTSTPSPDLPATISGGSRKKRLSRAAKLWIFIPVGVVLAAVVGFLIWANVGVMGAEPEPLAAARSNPAVTITEQSDSWTISPTAAPASEATDDIGLVFYPGAKVEASAYIAKLAQVAADSEVTVVIVKPWINLALFDLRPLDTFTKPEPDVDTWLVGGHSMGGVKSCQFAGDVDGLILFGSYCAGEVSGIPVLSISGSNDGLSTPEKIQGASGLLPADTTFVEIDGANHASFGNYGVQPGDGELTVPDSDVAEQITAAVGEYVNALRAAD